MRRTFALAKRESLNRKLGPVVQLVRIPACHAGGRGFESRPDRKQKSLGKRRGFFVCGPDGTRSLSRPRKSWERSDLRFSQTGSPVRIAPIASANAGAFLFAARTGREVYPVLENLGSAATLDFLRREVPSGSLKSLGKRRGFFVCGPDGKTASAIQQQPGGCYGAAASPPSRRLRQHSGTRSDFHLSCPRGAYFLSLGPKVPCPRPSPSGGA